MKRVFEWLAEADFEGIEHDTHALEEDGHGRHEERYVTVVHDPQGLPEGWAGVKAAVLVCRERRADGKSASTAHYYICSRRAKAKRIAE